jgi:multidrug efflux pump
LLVGGIFRRFNHLFRGASEGYAGAVTANIGRPKRIGALYAGLLALTAFGLWKLPGGFIPIQDKLYLISVLKMPEGSSLDRTEAVIRKMSDIAMHTDGVDSSVAFPGLNALQFTNTPNTGAIFICLKRFDERTRPAAAIAGELMGKFSQLQEGLAFAIMPPPILGIGNGSGFSLYLQDRAGLGYGELQNSVQTLQGALSQTRGMGFPISSYQANVPQLSAAVDRAKAKAEGIALTDLFETLQVYLGSIYVNDFNRFGRTYQVYAQADAPYRNRVETVGNLRTRNQLGQMVPIGSMVTLSRTYGPDPVLRYNGYPAADVLGQADPRLLSSSQAMAITARLADQVLPIGVTLQWTDLSFQQASEGHANLIVFPLCILLAFLVLAALYESWILPLAVILIVPMCLLSAVWVVWLTGGDSNIFVQIGLVVLMGLACKNAILIVEFARELELAGETTIRAAIQACRIRLRPIVMTSVAFIAGVTPLVLSNGAGAEVRRAMGITVFAGMIGVTLFGLLLTPVFYVALASLQRKESQEPGAAAALAIERQVAP